MKSQAILVIVNQALTLVKGIMEDVIDNSKYIETKKCELYNSELTFYKDRLEKLEDAILHDDISEELKLEYNDKIEEYIDRIESINNEFHQYLDKVQEKKDEQNKILMTAAIIGLKTLIPVVGPFMAGKDVYDTISNNKKDKLIEHED